MNVKDCKEKVNIFDQQSSTKTSRLKEMPPALQKRASLIPTSSNTTLLYSFFTRSTFSRFVSNSKYATNLVNPC
jgi:hypothetical protein